MGRGEKEEAGGRIAMNIFEVWAILQFSVVIIVALIVVWRGVMAVKDILVVYTEKIAIWASDRRKGL
jgi:hypothetical protein